MNKNLSLVIVGITTLMVGIGGGYYFRNYQLTKTRGNFQRLGAPNGQNGQKQIIGQRPAEGEIISIDEGGVTLKMQDGSSKIILFSDSTLINKSTNATKNDLKVSSKITVSGTQNSDGSITANNVLLNN